MGRLLVDGFLWRMKSRCAAASAVLAVLVFMSGLAARAQDQTAAPKTPPVLGTIKTIDGMMLTITTDSGSEVKVNVPAEAKLLRVPPGSKDLKEAQPLSFADLQQGDRVLVRTKAGDGGTTVAASVIAMKKADIAGKQSQEREEWQRHGIGGLVKSVDAAGNTVTIGTTTAAGSKDVTIHAGPKTVIRRYAPDSIKFDDAKLSTLAEIKPGDQVRARGQRSADGSEFTADEMVSGAFRNISGTISAVNASAGTVTVNDLTSKKLVEVKVTGDSQLRKLPQPMAARIAARLKGGADGAAAGGGQGTSNAASGGGAGAARSQPSLQSGGAPSGTGGAGGPGGYGGGMGGGQRGGGDMQQMLLRLPANTLADFQKGDAVMIVATAGANPGSATAITLIGGVEPILQASPQGASILTPWSLNSGGGGGDTGTP
jgi:co-chaperonin GroES (HSP10)